MEWGDFQTAQAFKDFVASIVAEELKKQRPPARYATVTEINMDDRSIMGTFIGESEPVRIPLLDVIPSAIGQEVRVTGGTNDRVVDAIRGTNNTDARAQTLEEENETRKPIFGEWVRSTTSEISEGVSTITWTGNKYDPIGGITLVDGGVSVLIPADGYYRVEVQANLSVSETNRTLYLQCVPVSGAASYDFGRSDLQAEASEGAWSGAGFPHRLASSAHFLAGDKIRLNIGSGANYTLLGGGPNRTHIFVERLYGGPLQDTIP